MDAETEPEKSNALVIDLSKYITPLVRMLTNWWWLIALAGFVIGVGFGLYNIATVGYSASSGVVLLRSRAEVSLGSSIQTLSQEDISLSGGATQLASVNQAQLEADRLNRRLNSLLGIIDSASVAHQVAEELRATGLFNNDELEISNLVAAISAEPYVSANIPDERAGSDSLRITAEASTPEKAALLANAWAKAYEQHVNAIYGQSSSAPFSEIAEQVKGARTVYDQAQEALLRFLTEDDRVNQLTRQIEEESAIVERLRSGRKTAIAAIVDKQVEVKQKLIGAYLEEDATNRLFAFQKDENAKRQILGTYLDAEVESRLMAINRDRELRLQIFAALITTEVKSKLLVLNAERDDRFTQLNQAYSRKQRLESLLSEARLMHDQLTQGGPASARSNGLALISLKLKVAGVTDTLPFERLELQTSSIDTLNPSLSAPEQLADLSGLISAIEKDLVELKKTIKTLSDALSQGLGYQSLDKLVASNLPTTTLTSGAASRAPRDLNSYISLSYADLFNIGGVARNAQTVATDTPLFTEIKTLYPELFQQGSVQALVEASAEQPSELSLQANKLGEDLLNLKGWEGVLEYSVRDLPLSREIITRENEIRFLQADVARLEQHRADLKQNRDLAWQAYSTLLSKEQEVKIASAAEGTEVRFAWEATPPRARSRSSVYMGFVGLLLGGGLGLVLAMVLEFRQAISDPTYWWNQTQRAWRKGREIAQEGLQRAQEWRAAQEAAMAAASVENPSTSPTVGETPPLPSASEAHPSGSDQAETPARPDKPSQD